MRKGKPINDPPPARILSIVIGRDRGKPTGMAVRPERESDWTIYYPRGWRSGTMISAETSSLADYPRQVFWVVSNLEPNETIVIEPKPTDHGGPRDYREPKADGVGPFPDSSFEIAYPSNGVASGAITPAALQLPHYPSGSEERFSWEYNIILLSKGKETARLDPVIIIEPDP
jgi:hypothetical protein